MQKTNLALQLNLTRLPFSKIRIFAHICFLLQKANSLKTNLKLVERKFKSLKYVKYTKYQKPKQSFG